MNSIWKLQIYLKTTVLCPVARDIFISAHISWKVFFIFSQQEYFGLDVYFHLHANASLLYQTLWFCDHILGTVSKATNYIRKSTETIKKQKKRSPMSTEMEKKKSKLN